MSDNIPLSKLPLASKEANTPKDSKYVGPKYKKGIVMTDGRTYKPAEMTAAKAKEFVEKFPAKSIWWKPAV